MAAFSYQHMTPFLLDSVLLQNMTRSLPGGGVMEVGDDGFINSNCFSSYTLPTHDDLGGSQLEESSKTSAGGDVNGPPPTVVDDKLESEEQVSQKVATTTTTTTTTSSPVDKRRKNSSGPSSNSAQPKGGREGRGKRQKKGNGEVKEEEKGKPEKKDHKDAPDQEPPTGYIHVRARRGQATDSHSLAERVRREKISERMKILQRLVPGCDKVNGKALMLDEIINYVQSLQNQVEFLSMKLASVNPLFYEFGMDLDAFMVLPERISNMESPSLSPMQQCSPTQPTTFVDANTTTATAATVATAAAAATSFATAGNSYPLMDSALPLLLQGQRPINFSQDTASLLWDLEEQRQKFPNPSWFSNNNLSSFH